MAQMALHSRNNVGTATPVAQQPSHNRRTRNDARNEKEFRKAAELAVNG